MHLLITTQAVDKDDPILGFFHGWLQEFSKHFSHIHVICLNEGLHDLPSNVSVHSLGKELGENRLRYLVRFFRYAWRLRNEYDAIFSHMNPHYIVLMGWFWSLTRKPIYFWRNHARMNLMTRIAAFFSRKVFYTSPFACMRRFTHSVQMPVGIDTNVFHPRVGVERKAHSVLFLGRISGVKRPELFAEASTLLSGYSVDVYGDEQGNSHTYRAKLEHIAGGKLNFHPSVSNYKTPEIYSAYDVYVNLTPEGSMDKTVLEAAACGTLVLVSNRSFEGMVPEACLLKETTKEGIASQIQELSNLKDEQKNEYRIQLQRMVEERHSLTRLVTELITQFSI